MVRGVVVKVCQFGQPRPGLPYMWGSAAWAQTQLTPGVSTLAAPRSSIEGRSASMGRP